MLILSEISKGRDDPADNILYINIFGQLLEFQARDASNFGLNIVDILDNVR